MTFFDKPLILASQSPRRKQLLEMAGFEFEVIPSPYEEVIPDHLPIEEVPQFLAEEKAKPVLQSVSTNAIVLAADSLVMLDGKIYGKPRSLEEARDHLAKLSGKTHRVITGVCLMSNQKTVSFSCTSEVTMAEMSQAEIEYYVDRHQPLDKAGSYGIQEWVGICMVQAVKGSYVNIVGLPMHLVYEALKSF